MPVLGPHDLLNPIQIFPYVDESGRIRRVIALACGRKSQQAIGAVVVGLVVQRHRAGVRTNEDIGEAINKWLFLVLELTYQGGNNASRSAIVSDRIRRRVGQAEQLGPEHLSELVENGVEFDGVSQFDQGDRIVIQSVDIIRVVNHSFNWQV
jgi:hypothetical protein